MKTQYARNRLQTTPDAAVDLPVRPVGFRVPVTQERGLPDPTARYLFNEALGRGHLHGAYFISQALHEWFPHLAVVEGMWPQFDLIHFAQSGGCTLTARSSPFAQWLTGISERSDGSPRVCRHPWVAWLDIVWNGQDLQVVRVPAETQRVGPHTWIIAERAETAHAFLKAVFAWTIAPRSEILVYGDGEFERDPRLFAAIKGATLDALVLPDGLGETIQSDAAGFFAARDVYLQYGAPWKRGVLLTGPPGNGKTQTVKALINTLGQRCIYVKSFRNSSSPSEESIREVFDRARHIAPCVIVLEDLDSMIDKWNRAYFLNELDGFAGNDGILTIATTNHPEKLDPAIIDRPSRFDRKYLFNLPALTERQRYLRRWNDRAEPDMRLSDDGLERFAQETAGFSYAYLKELTLASMLRWIGTRVPGGMDVEMAGELAVLRQQMTEARMSRRQRKDRLRAEQEAAATET